MPFPDSGRDAGAPQPDGSGRDAEAFQPDVGVLRLSRRAPPPLPLAVFGAEWSQWIAAAASAACCPADYVAAPLLACASALIGNARWAQATPGWEEPPNLWLGTIGDSGDGKSPGSDALFRYVIPEIERRMLGDFPDRHREWQAAAAVAKLRRESWKRAVGRADKERQDAPPWPADADAGPEPQAPRLEQHDVTIERVATILAGAAPKGLLMIRDELAGFLLGMTAYSDAARPFWLEAYGGRPYRVERQKHPEPIVINHLVVSWFGTIQPDRLAAVMENADDGLMARFCWCWPDPIAFDMATSAPNIPFAIEALDRLRVLDLQRSNEGTSTPSYVPLADAARACLVAFARDMQLSRELSAGLLRSAYGKTRGLALRLSLVLEFLWWCGRDGMQMPPAGISAGAMEAATTLVRDYLMPMAARAYGDAASSMADRNTTILARWIAQERPTEVRVRRLQRGELPYTPLPGLKDAAKIHAACRALVDAHWLLPPASFAGVRGGRPPAAYPVNPQLWTALSQAEARFPPPVARSTELT